MKRKILLSALLFLVLVLSFFTCFFLSKKINDEKAKEENEVDNKKVIVSNEVLEEVEKTQEAVQNNEQLDTMETEDIKESEIEEDAVVEQENTSYDGSNNGNGLSLLGAYRGLTYYNQSDSKWANKLYTSTNNKTQTMKSSGCGPTACAMVVTASKGTILPTTMAKLFVDNGYRTANSGTAWSAMSFTADYFDFNEYYTTTSYTKAMSYLKDGYYIIASCDSGLFTTSGHYIFLTGISGSTIKIYDPYLYSRKI